jgi:hypothetical protein
MSDLRETLISAILETVLEVHRGNADVPIIVDANIVQDALVVAMATIIEAALSLRTSRDMREAGEHVGKQVTFYLKAMRRQYEETGARLWDGQTLTPQ